MSAAIPVALGALIAVSPTPARAATNVVDKPGKQASIDWTRGLVLASGAAPGDLRAPSPSVARVKARRIAGARARARLGRLVRALRHASGEAVGSILDKDAAAKERFERALAGAMEIDLDLGSDGSVVATLGLPLEAVRWALAPAPLAPQAGPGASAIVVDATALELGPSLGLAIAAGSERYAGPTVFHRRLAAARADVRAGSRVVAAKATGLAGGVLAVRGLEPSTLAAARKAGALVLVVLREKEP